MAMAMDCPLCLSDDTHIEFTDVKRAWLYWQCSLCGFLYRDGASRLAPRQEHDRYTTHNNSIESPGYVKFLSPVVEALVPRLKLGDQGLDYGSGPGPILQILFGREGFDMKNYDPYFQPEPQPELAAPYDFITCTEVFEHFYKPACEMDRLNKLLKPGGWLVIMTQMQPERERLPQWGYRMDNTHVGFLNPKSLHWLCQHWGFEWVEGQDRLFLLRKKH